MTGPIPEALRDALYGRVMACSCGCVARGVFGVTVEACRCGRVPLNDAERWRCPRCKTDHGVRVTEAGEAPILLDRVVWCKR